MEEYKKETIDSYNKNAKEFSKKFLELTEINRRYEFQRFIELLLGKDILDLGCGSGEHSKYFSKFGLNVLAIDLSEEMIKLCKKTKLNAIIMDIEDLKINDKRFDGIWAVTSLLHIPKSKLPSVIEKLYEILKSNGIIYICIKEGEGEGFIRDKEFNSQRFFSFWKKEEFLKLFEKRFNLIEFRKIKLGHSDFLQFFFRKI